MKRSLKKKVRKLGVIQLFLIAVIMTLLGVLFFNKMLSDEERFEQGTAQVKLNEAEGLAKLLALELGREDTLRYARSEPQSQAAKEVRAILWEKVTFINALNELDLIATNLRGKPFCLRPKGWKQGCNEIQDIAQILSGIEKLDRMKRVGDGVFVLPLYVAGAYWGVVRMAVSNTNVQHTLGQMAHKNEQDKAAFVVLFLVCVSVAGLVLTLFLTSFSQRIYQPLVTLAGNVVAFGEKPDAVMQPVDADPEDEVGVLAHRFEEMQVRLAETFDSLTHAVDQKEQAMRDMEDKDRLLRQSERLASVGVLAAGVAHEIGNKLNPMGFVVHNLKKRIEKGKDLDAEQLEVLTRSIQNCSSIIEKLRALAHPEQQQPDKPVNLNEVARDVTMLLGAQSKSRGVTVNSELAEDLPMIRGVHSDLVQVVINLVLNAREAVIAAAKKEKQVDLITRVDGSGRAVVEVRDNGVGMSSDVQARIFEPFFTTKGMNTGGGEGGTGLGLYICYGILSRHGVEPEIESIEGEGTCFVLSFPLNGEETHESNA